VINNLKYSATKVAEVVDGTLYGSDVVFNGISISSKEKSSYGHCFFAIKGKKYDGADYIEEAISNGASLIVTQRKISCPVSTIYVEDAVKAFGMLAKYHKGNTRVIGVTGSYGKTCVKDMIISVLSEKYTVTGTRDNYNNEIGVPLTLLSVKNEDFCVVEMGMRAGGEIEWLSYISEPDLAVVTSCGTSHIEILGSVEKIFEAKMEILKHTKSCCVLPSTKLFNEYNSEGLKKILVGEGGEHYIDYVKQGEETVHFKINGYEFNINSTYSHNAENALFAYAVGKYYGLTEHEIKSGLEKWQQRENRGGAEYYKGIKIINDCYNASYESVLSAISSLSSHKNNNGILAVLLGDMRELGGQSAQLHFNVGKHCKEKGISKLFAVGCYAKDIICGFGDGKLLNNDNEIAEKVISELSAGDVLLVKASHAMNFEKIIRDMREK